MQAARDAFETSWRSGRQFRDVDAARLVAVALRDLVPADRADEVAVAYREATLQPGLRTVPGATEAVRALADRGVRLGIVCDVGLTPSRVLRAELDRLGLLDAFAAWAFSDEVGVYKPDPRIFEHALAGLGVGARVAWHVGDRRDTDVAGARAAGMRAVRLTVEVDDPAPGPSADHVCADYDEVLAVLGVAPAR